MKIRRVEFVGAIGRPDQAPPSRLPQIVFSGRSNVGKSSLINRLLGRTRRPIARVSSTPGKTQEINFFHIEAVFPTAGTKNFLLVDLPGYGYARVPHKVRDRWKPLIEGFLERSEELVGIIQLIDARHGPSAGDRTMIHYLAETATPTLFVLTKIDKLKRQERHRQLPTITKAIGASAEQVIPFSSETGEGRDDLIAALDVLLRSAK